MKHVDKDEYVDCKTVLRILNAVNNPPTWAQCPCGQEFELNLMTNEYKEIPDGPIKG